MTIIEFPDLSQYNAGDRIEPGTVVVVARATLSDRIADTSYQDFKSQAASVGAFFMAYHWMNHGNIAGQVKWVYAHIGKTPLMLDCEDMPGNTGYNGPITVDDIVQFATQYRALGGICNIDYVPHWYWADHMGSPDLTPLVDAGQHLVASEYRAFNESMWPAAYGHMNPEEWQFTDVEAYGGKLVDFNAYRGTVQDFITLATGGAMSDQLLNGWRVPVTEDGKDDTRGAGIWVNDLWKYYRDGNGAYQTGKRDGTSDPSNGSYVDTLLTVTRDSVKSANALVATVNAKVDGISARVDSLAGASGGLTDADRALLQSVVDAVNTLNSRLATP